jgi:hypothetical protein
MREQQCLDNTHLDTLMELYRCKAPSCPNYAGKGYCWPVDARRHLRIFVPQLRAWSIAINNDDATLDQPTEAFLCSLLPTRPGQQNPYTVAKPKTPKTPGTPSQDPVQFPSQHYPPHASYPPYYSPNPYPPHLYPPYPYPPPPHSYPPTHPGLGQSPMPQYYTASPQRPSHVQSIGEPPSSPTLDPTQEQGPVARLERYRDWLIRTNPSQANVIREAVEKLIDNQYSFRLLKHISGESLKEMGICGGLALLLKHEIEAFKRAESKGRV